MDLVKKISEKYTALMANGDQRLADWPLMTGPLPTVTICCLYVYFVKYLGPQLMKNRPPFNIRNMMIFYNFVMVIISALIVYVFGAYGWFNGYSYACQPVDYSSSPEALLIAQTSYYYFAVKFLEFFDTIFFVLRKKFSHISTLHVIHHGVMPFSVWWGLKFVPGKLDGDEWLLTLMLISFSGGHATFFGFLNSFVHVIMYTYYGLAAIGPQMNKYLWWKKYLTVIQMIQFVLIFLHAFQLVFRECNFPRIFGLWISAHGVLFWFLFSHFYKKTYTSTDSASQSKANALLSTCIPAETLIKDMNGAVTVNGAVKANGIHKSAVNGYHEKEH